MPTQTNAGQDFPIRLLSFPPIVDCTGGLVDSGM